jgi:hypothetical protein
MNKLDKTARTLELRVILRVSGELPGEGDRVVQEYDVRANFRDAELDRPQLCRNLHEDRAPLLATGITAQPLLR